MIYIACFIILFGLLRLCVAFVNMTSPVYLPREVKVGDEPLVSILIPARNEEKTIGVLLEDIRKLTYTNYEVIVYNDNSTDRTNETVGKHMSQNNKIKIIQGKEPEPGWLGKNYACHQLSQHAAGQYFLFLDADVRVSNNLIEKVLSLMKQHHLGLLSIFPKQVMQHTGVLFAVPLMNWILLSLLPLLLVRISNWTSFSAANGQFMLFDVDLYHKMTPHLICKSNKVEDIAICRYYKKNRITVSTLLGDNDIQCVMYNTLADAINGFSKNIVSFFGNSTLVTIVFALFTTLAPFYLLCFQPILFFIVYLVCIILIRVFVSIASHQNCLLNVLFLPIQHLVFLTIIAVACFRQKNKSLTWKGRNIT